MNKIYLITLLMIPVFTGWSQTNSQQLLLDNFIEAHNKGTDEAFNNFINSNYSDELLDKVNFNAHIDFYRQISSEFGPLNPMIYKTINQENNQLIVQLIGKNESLLNQNIDPNSILVVHIDQHSKKPSKLEKGLGLGTLLCETKKGK